MWTSDKYLPCDYCGCIFKVEPHDEFWDDDHLICPDCTVTGITKIDVVEQYEKENIFANYTDEELIDSYRLVRRERIIQEFFEKPPSRGVGMQSLGRYNIANRISKFCEDN